MSILSLVLILSAGRSAPVAAVLAAGLALRSFAGWLDQTKRVSLPWSGADSEVFYALAVQYSLSPIDAHMAELSPQSSYFFAWFMGWIIRMFGPEYFYLRFINMIIGGFTALFVYRSVLVMGGGVRTAFLALCVFVFFPFTVILSSVFLRESIIAFSISAATLGMALYYFQARMSGLLIAVMSAMLGSLFHGAIAIVLLLFLCLLAFISPQPRAFGLQTKSGVPGELRLILGVCSMSALVYLVIYGEFSKIGSFATALDSIGQRFDRVSLRGAKGGSAYPEWLTGNIANPLYWVPRFIYFIAAPFPWDWRTLSDAASAVLGIFYVFLLYWSFRARSANPGFFVLFVIMFVCLFVFSLGTDNVGTAIRHRTKFFPLLLSVGMMGWILRPRARGSDRFLASPTSSPRSSAIP